MTMKEPRAMPKILSDVELKSLLRELHVDVSKLEHLYDKSGTCLSCVECEYVTERCWLCERCVSCCTFNFNNIVD